MVTNRDTLIQELEKLKEERLITAYQVVADGDKFIFKMARSIDGAPIEIKTNLIDKYLVILDSRYEEFTDYLLENEEFKTHIDWFMPLIKAFLNFNYYEEKYVDRKSSKVLFSKLVFNKEVGLKELSTKSSTAFFVKRSLGLVKKIDVRH